MPSAASVSQNRPNRQARAPIKLDHRTARPMMNLILSLWSGAEKAIAVTGKGKGLTRSKLKGRRGTKIRRFLSMSSKSGDMDEVTSFA